MRVCVFGAAPVPDDAGAYRRIAAGCDAVVAADAGALACLDMGIMPALAVGDFDSACEDGVARLREAGVPMEVHPADKNASDLDLALEAARGMGADAVVVTAAFTGRVDHTLAAFGTVLAAADLPAVAVEPGWHAHSAGAGHGGTCTLDLPAGTAVSVLSPTGAHGVDLDGVRFPLHDATLPPLTSLGISNEALGGLLTASCSTGALFVIVLQPA